MVKTIGLIAVIIVVALAGTFYAVKNNKTNEGDTLQLLPTVDLYDESGASVSVYSIIQGKPAIINSWASWCPFCVHELPDFITLQKELGDNVVIVAINRGENTQTGVDFLKEINAEEDLIYLYDPKDKWYQATGGYTMPETIFINSSGEIVLHRRGVISLEEMRELTKLIHDTTP
jgi:thiol-disulfide isomerase/thioredoxin